jgi:hypothetical protein
MIQTQGTAAKIHPDAEAAPETNRINTTRLDGVRR